MVIRKDLKALETQYNGLAAVLDRVIANDLSISREDIQEEQTRRRKNLWNCVFKNDYQYLTELIFHLNQFPEIQEEKQKKDDEEFYKHLISGTLDFYNFTKKDE